MTWPAVRLPLEALRGDEPLREMVAERVDHDLVRLERVDGVLEVVGEHADVAALELDLVEPVQGLLYGRRQRQPPLDAVEPAAEHHREGEIRVARRIRAAQLDTGGLGTPDVRDADERAAIGARP